MKKKLKKAYQSVLRHFAARYLDRNDLSIIAITGSVGKTSTREAVYQVLSSKFKVGKNAGNQNEETGVPITVLGLSVGRFPFGWAKNIFSGFLKSWFAKNHFDKLILEMGADHPGDIEYLTSFAKPNIAIVTRVACSHLEFFCSLENVAKEKGILVESLSKDGWAILNQDDPNVRNMAKRTKAKVFYFGLDKTANLYADEISAGTDGLDFTVHYKNKSGKVHLNIVGKHLIYSALAGIACGIVCGLEFEDAITAIKDFKTEKGRLDLVNGIRGSLVINDTYNANPESVTAAIQTLNDLSGKKRRVAVLGDMLELGEGSHDFHREIGRLVSKKADILVAVGPLSRFTYEEAEKLMGKNAFWSSDSESAIETVQNNIKSGDMVLVKGSRGMKMEKIVESIKL